MPYSKAPKIDFAVSDEQLTGSAGLALVATLASWLDLPCQLAQRVRVKRRRRGCADEQMLLSLIYSFCAGGGHLSDVDSLGRDRAAQRITGLKHVPDSRRLGEYLARMSALPLAGLQACVRHVCACLAGQWLRRYQAELGYVPVFVDGTGIEVEGRCFEQAGRGYNGERQYWLHSVFVGVLWVSARLQPGGSDVAGGWREQLEQDLRPLLRRGERVWLRADNAYYRGELVSYCIEQGWDYSISLTNERNQQPLVRKLLACEYSDQDWTALDAEGEEEALLLYYRPQGWQREEVYVVIRRSHEQGQRLLVPHYSFILVSRDDLPLAELVRRHRAKQGQENAFKGPLRELNLHHPPCKSYAANQAYYLCGQLAQLLLRGLQMQLLPETAQGHGLGPLVRQVVRSVARLTRSGRRLRLHFARSNRRLGWLEQAWLCLEPPG